MTDKPILFSGPMVGALLDGRKTQTRRVITGPAAHDALSVFEPDFLALPGNVDLLPVRARAGDRLWVRETHAFVPCTAYRASIGTGTIDQREHPTDGYTAALFREGFDRSGSQHWRPSIHMPRWASRLTLTVTDVRVQRLQEISAEDSRDEGCAGDLSMIRQMDLFGATEDERANLKLLTSRWQFKALWDSLNAKRGYGWDANPWVAAYTFTVQRQNIDQMESAA